MAKKQPNLNSDEARKEIRDKALALLQEITEHVRRSEYWDQTKLRPGECVIVGYDGKREGSVFCYRPADGRAPATVAKQIAALDRMVGACEAAYRLLKEEATHEANVVVQQLRSVLIETGDFFAIADEPAAAMAAAAMDRAEEAVPS